MTRYALLAVATPALVAASVFIVRGRPTSVGEASTKEKEVKSIYDFALKDINGKEVKLDQYRGIISPRSESARLHQAGRAAGV